MLDEVGIDGVFRGRLKEIVDQLGGTTAAAERVQVSREALWKWLEGKARPPLLSTAALCAAAGKSMDWLVGFVAPGQEEERFAYIPRLNVEASAGNGAVAAEEDIDGLVAFRREWLRRVGITPEAARVLRARGDSMEPTIRDGDILLVDTGIDRVRDEGIYVVVVAGLVLVKRLQRRRDGTVVLRSDNRELYDDEIVPPSEAPELHVAGRVMWFGRSI